MTLYIFTSLTFCANVFFQFIQFLLCLFREFCKSGGGRDVVNSETSMLNSLVLTCKKVSKTILIQPKKKLTINRLMRG